MRIFAKRALRIFPELAVLVSVSASLVPGLVFAQTAGVAGFSGKVVQVTSAAAFTGEVRIVYAGAQQFGGVAGILPPGKVVTINVPSSTKLVDVRNRAVTLTQISAGTLFNATVTVDTATRTVTASKIVFGTRLLAPPIPAESPTPTSPPTPSGSPPPTPSGSPPPTISPPPAPKQAEINFAGKVVSVDSQTRVANVTVRAVFGGTSGGFRLGVILPPETRLTLTVPEGIPITRIGGQITLADVKPGDLFNARATVDLQTKTGIAKSIQVITPKLSENVYTGTLTAMTTTDPKTVTVKNQAGTETQFTVATDAKIFIGRTPGTFDQLVVGRNVAVQFVTLGDVKQAARIVMATEQLQGRLDKFLSAESTQRRGEGVLKILTATLDRLGKIIAKQETRINELKASGKDTTKAEASLAVSKTDLATAQTNLADAQTKVGAISGSADTKAAATVARDALKKTAQAEKKVLQDIHATQQQIKAISE